MEEIIVLDLQFEFGPVKDVIHPVVLKDTANMVWIDCGYTGFLPILEAAMQEKRLACSELTHVVITHQDHDHTGSLAELIQKYPHMKRVDRDSVSGYA